MNNVVDEVLSGAPRYTIKDNGGTTIYDDVQIDLKTAVTTQGTPLNKALFDSIQSDLNTRLLISSKATTAQAQAGTNDTNYMTAKKVQDKLNYLTTTMTAKTNNTTTLIDFSQYSGKIFTVRGWIIKGQNGADVKIGDTTIFSFTTVSGLSTKKCCFEIVVDMNTNTYFANYYDSTTDNKRNFTANYISSLTTLVIDPIGSGSPAPEFNFSIQVNS